MILWTRAFQDEIGEPADDTELGVDRGLAAGQLWLWDRRGEAVSMAVTRELIHGVVRLSGVYTPPQHRRQGLRGGMRSCSVKTVVCSRVSMHPLYGSE